MADVPFGRLCMECNKRILYGIWCIGDANLHFMFCNEDCKAKFIERFPKWFDLAPVKIEKPVKIVKKGYFM